MGGGSSIAGMQASFRNNRNLLKRDNSLRKRASLIKTSHVESRNTRHLSEEELLEFKAILKKKNRYNFIVSVVIAVVLLLVLIVFLLLISN
jgi:hypothetical protein